jgi:antitoxin component YwqK of YwqJK toxin-antitoxin module
VTLTFEGDQGKTKFTLRHVGIPAGQMRELTEAGWNESFDKLADALRTIVWFQVLSWATCQSNGCTPMKMDKSKYAADGRPKNGMIKECFKDGALSCVGEYRNGAKIGEWKYYLRNGSLKAIGRYSNGELTGEWKWYRENGKLMQTGSFDDEKRMGVWTRYHPNGALYDEGEYVNDKRAGEWRTYDTQGKLTKTTRHKR